MRGSEPVLDAELIRMMAEGDLDLRLHPLMRHWTWRWHGSPTTPLRDPRNVKVALLRTRRVLGRTVVELLNFTYYELRRMWWGNPN